MVLLLYTTRSLRSSINVRDGVSHPYKRTGRAIVLFILIFQIADRKAKDTEMNSSNHFQDLMPSSARILICCVSVVPRQLSQHFQSYRYVVVSCILLPRYKRLFGFLSTYVWIIVFANDYDFSSKYIFAQCEHYQRRSQAGVSSAVSNLLCVLGQ